MSLPDTTPAACVRQATNELLTEVPIATKAEMQAASDSAAKVCGRSLRCGLFRVFFVDVFCCPACPHFLQELLCGTHRLTHRPHRPTLTASKAFKTWRNSSVMNRQTCMLKLAQLIRENQASDMPCPCSPYLPLLLPRPYCCYVC